jgi:hypothetical protein
MEAIARLRPNRRPPPTIKPGLSQLHKVETYRATCQPGRSGGEARPPSHTGPRPPLRPMLEHGRDAMGASLFTCPTTKLKSGTTVDLVGAEVEMHSHKIGRPSLRNGCVGCSRKTIACAAPTRRYFPNTKIREIPLRLGQVAGGSHVCSVHSLGPEKNSTISEFIIHPITLVGHTHKPTQRSPTVVSIDRAGFIDAVAPTERAVFHC